MKKLVLIVLFAFLGINANAQEKKSKNKKVVVEVSGNCNMCEKRIEKAAFSVKGVKTAEFHTSCQDIHLLIDETKCSVLDVEKAIAAVGHDTKNVKASNEVYDKIHDCCKYREKE